MKRGIVTKYEAERGGKEKNGGKKVEERNKRGRLPCSQPCLLELVYSLELG